MFQLTVERQKNYEAINVAAAGKTLTLNATTNGTILLNDYINGVSGYNVLLTGDSTGTIKLFDKADIKGGANVSVGGNVLIDTADGVIQNFSEFNSLNSSANAKYNIDLDLSKASGDKLDYAIGDKMLERIYDTSIFERFCNSRQFEFCRYFV